METTKRRRLIFKCEIRGAILHELVAREVEARMKRARRKPSGPYTVEVEWRTDAGAGTILAIGEAFVDE